MPIVVNLLFSLAELIVFFAGIEFYSGGICEYWKCQTCMVSIWVGLVMIHFCVNCIMLIGREE
jgi:hypothetical protein